MFAGTKWQRFVVSDLSLWAWFIAGQLVGFAILYHTVRPSLASTTDLWFWLMAIVCVPLTVLVSLFASFLVGSIVLPPFYYVQGLVNGGPFQVGDQVIVLTGPHAGHKSSVYELWQDCVRVKLDPDDEIYFRDVFPSHKLLRVPNDGPSHASEPAGSVVSK